MTDVHDVVIVGGGHNALTAAAYLARAGRRVLLLERSHHLGGAAISSPVFEGVEARLSRYSYLVSLLPQQIITDLGLDLTLVRRRFSSYTPDPGDPTRGLLIDAAATPDLLRTAFARVGASQDAEAWADWYEGLGALAQAVFPTFTQPLPTRRELHRAVVERDGGPGGRGDRTWYDVVERPIGEAIERRFVSDLVRGVVATDALIGTFSDLNADDLAQNRCYLYHVVGGGTGDWDVPVGGMGAVSTALERAARAAGADLRTGCVVTAVTPDGEVTWREGEQQHRVSAGVVLAGVAPAELDRLIDAGIGLPAQEGDTATPEGAQVKVNLLLTRLPRLKDTTVSPEAAFAGTFHINELASQLRRAWEQADAGRLPDPLPQEIYCHTLSDRSILAPDLAASPAQTLTVFSLHVPHRLVSILGNEKLRSAAERAVLASLDSVLAEPIADVLARDAHGRPCLEVRTTADLEASVAMPGGHIFHGPLSWPWREDEGGEGEGRLRERLTPAQRWGVATRHNRILLCGSGAVRGGGVSGVAGHNAAMAVLEAAR